jgi:hypothetical protein
MCWCCARRCPLDAPPIDAHVCIGWVHSVKLAVLGVHSAGRGPRTAQGLITALLPDANAKWH